MNSFFIISLLSLIIIINQVYGHGYLSTPTARTGTDQTVHSPVPCGGVAKGAVQATWQAGSQQNVLWNIVANHGGSVSLYINFDGQPETTNQFAMNPLLTNQPIVSGTNTGQITVPNQNCVNCTLNWVWTPTASGEQQYWGCADVAISNASPAIQSLGPNAAGSCIGGLLRCSSANNMIHSGILLLFVILSTILFYFF